MMIRAVLLDFGGVIAEEGETLFVDDSPGHIDRANGKGLQTHLYVDWAGYLARLEELGLNENKTFY